MFLFRQGDLISKAAFDIVIIYLFKLFTLIIHSIISNYGLGSRPLGATRPVGVLLLFCGVYGCPFYIKPKFYLFVYLRGRPGGVLFR